MRLYYGRRVCCSRWSRWVLARDLTGVFTGIYTHIATTLRARTRLLRFLYRQYQYFHMVYLCRNTDIIYIHRAWKSLVYSWSICFKQKGWWLISYIFLMSWFPHVWNEKDVYVASAIIIFGQLNLIKKVKTGLVAITQTNSFCLDKTLQNLQF